MHKVLSKILLSAALLGTVTSLSGCDLFKFQNKNDVSSDDTSSEIIVEPVSSYEYVDDVSSDTYLDLSSNLTSDSLVESNVSTTATSNYDDESFTDAVFESTTQKATKATTKKATKKTIKKTTKKTTKAMTKATTKKTTVRSTTKATPATKATLRSTMITTKAMAINTTYPTVFTLPTATTTKTTKKTTTTKKTATTTTTTTTKPVQMYSINTSISSNGKITDSVNSIKAGSSMTISWSADLDYIITSVKIDGKEYKIDNTLSNSYKSGSYEFTNISGNHSVEVTTGSFNANSAASLKRLSHTHSFGTIHAMLDCAKTYFNYAYTPDGKKSGILYETGNGLYSDSLGNNAANGQYGMVCSQFAEAVINGVTFNNSRYVKGVNSKNTQSSWGIVFDDTIPFGRTVEPTQMQIENKYLTSQSLARYATEHAYLYPVKGNENAVQAGDLLFSGNVADRYLGIDHVVMVVNTDGTYCTVVESWPSTKADGNDVGVRIRYHESLSKFSYGAAFPVGYVGAAPSLIEESNSNLSGNTASGATVINQFNEKVDQGFYTIVCTGTFDTAPYVSLKYDGNSSNTYQSVLHSVGNKYYLTVYAEKPATVSLRMVAGNHYEGVKASLYDGYAGA